MADCVVAVLRCDRDAHRRRTRVPAGDTAEAPPIVVVNQALARQVWSGADPVGRRLRLGRDPQDPWMTVVGVVSDMRHGGPAAPPRPEIYQPLPNARSARWRSSSAPPSIRTLPFRSFAPRSRGCRHRCRWRTWQRWRNTSRRALSRPRFMSVLDGGVRGTGRRTRAGRHLRRDGSVGVAADPRDRDSDGAWCADPRSRVDDCTRSRSPRRDRSGCGVLAAWAASRVLAGLLFGVTPGDPATYLRVRPAHCSSWHSPPRHVPALRAARIDGAQMLRS